MFFSVGFVSGLLSVQCLECLRGWWLVGSSISGRSAVSWVGLESGAVWMYGGSRDGRCGFRSGLALAAEWWCGRLEGGRSVVVTSCIECRQCGGRRGFRSGA